MQALQPPRPSFAHTAIQRKSYTGHTAQSQKKCFWPKWLRLDSGLQACIEHLHRFNRFVFLWSLCLAVWHPHIIMRNCNIQLINVQTCNFLPSIVNHCRTMRDNSNVRDAKIQSKQSVICLTSSAGPSGNIKCEFSTTAHHSGSIGVLWRGNWIRIIASVIHYSWCMVRCKQWFDQTWWSKSKHLQSDKILILADKITKQTSETCTTALHHWGIQTMQVVGCRLKTVHGQPRFIAAIQVTRHTLLSSVWIL